jgi:hypothetical protein
MLKRFRHLAAAMPSAPALAADKLPIAGPYGDVEAKGCDDYQGETEGGYIIFDKEGRVGSVAVRSSPSRNPATANMPTWPHANPSNGPKETWRRKLIVLSNSEIEWNGSKYRKYKPLA